MTKWLKRLCDYWKDKKMAEKCGMEVKDICVHARDDCHPPLDVIIFKCQKCGEFYK